MREPALACGRRLFGKRAELAADTRVELEPDWADFYFVAEEQVGPLGALACGGFTDRREGRAWICTSVLGPEWDVAQHGLATMLARTVVHEWTHLVYLAAIPSEWADLPAWYSEGVAEWAAGRVVDGAADAARPSLRRDAELAVVRLALLDRPGASVESDRDYLVDELGNWQAGVLDYSLAHLLLCRLVASRPDERPERVIGTLAPRIRACVDAEASSALAAAGPPSPDEPYPMLHFLPRAASILRELVTPEFVAWLRDEAVEWTAVSNLLDRTRTGVVQSAAYRRISDRPVEMWPFALAWRDRPVTTERAGLRASFRVTTTGPDDEVQVSVGADLSDFRGAGEIRDVLVVWSRGGDLRVWRRRIEIGRGFAQDLSSLASVPAGTLEPDELHEIEARVDPERLRVVLDGREALDVPVEGLVARGRCVGMGAGVDTTVLWERLDLVER